MNTPQKAVVIGAGIGGIATSIRLACLGIEVTVLEANDYPGGKLSEVQLGDYRFDAGPSLFTMPHFIEELFELAQEPIEQYFRYQRMPIACQYFFDDGTQLTAWGNEEQFIDELATKTGEPIAHIQKFLAHSRELYEITEHVFLKKSLHKIGTYLSLGTLQSAMQLHKLNVFQSMNRANEGFFRSPKLVQFFNRFATYNGSNPYQAPATLNVIPHLENGFGTFLPEGGMHQITQSLFLLAKKLGVSFLMGHRAEEILYAHGRVQGVRAHGTVFSADIVVSNMDMVGTYRKLLPQLAAPERLLRQPKSSSALIFYWGIKKQFPQLDLHNIFFSGDYRREFHEMFQHKTIGPDPTMYVNITSKFTQGDAPAYGENWFTMVNAPNEQGQDWERLIEQTKTNVVEKLSRLLKTPIAP